MKVFDFNIHLPYLQEDDINAVIDNDLSLTTDGLIKGLARCKSKLERLEGANFLLFNTDLFSSSVNSFVTIAKQYLSLVTYTALVDFRRSDLMSYLEKVKSQGAKAIMVNSYLQQISNQDFLKVGEACKYAEANKMVICIDGSYGTSKMYNYDNLKLACFVSDLVTKVPIVIVHSGGLRVKEAMLLAFEKPNVWLDTSFSLPFYIGSSLEQDYAFVYKKIGLERVVYGSDTPYLNSEKSIKTNLDFFHKYNFSQSDIKKIMHDNAMNLLNH